MPLSTTINMNGGVLYFSCCSIFCAQIFGIELSTYQYFLIFIMSMLCEIGIAPVPGASILFLGTVFSMVGIPVEAIGMMFGIDRALDMVRSFVNIKCRYFCNFFY